MEVAGGVTFRPRMDEKQRSIAEELKTRITDNPLKVENHVFFILFLVTLRLSLSPSLSLSLSLSLSQGGCASSHPR